MLEWRFTAMEIPCPADPPCISSGRNAPRFPKRPSHTPAKACVAFRSLFRTTRAPAPPSEPVPSVLRPSVRIARGAERGGREYRLESIFPTQTGSTRRCRCPGIQRARRLPCPSSLIPGNHASSKSGFFGRTFFTGRRARKMPRRFQRGILQGFSEIQANRTRTADLRRRRPAPTAPKPRNIRSQVAGSGTAFAKAALVSTRKPLGPVSLL